jgi:hypothetical protein
VVGCRRDVAVASLLVFISAMAYLTLQRSTNIRYKEQHLPPKKGERKKNKI